MASNEMFASMQMGNTERQQPLAGVRVLELGSFVAAPLAARQLADFGAEVIKVEPPHRGDELRTWGTMVPTRTGEISAWWLEQSRNKRLIALDLHSNVYQTADGHWLANGGNGENVFRRLVQIMGKPTLIEDQRFHNNRTRVEHHHELDEIVGAWFATLTLTEAQTMLDNAGVPAGPVMSIADIAANQHFQERDMLLSVPDERMPDGVTFMAGIVPCLTETPGTIVHSGGDLGADNQTVYGNFLGIGQREMELLQIEGII